MSNGEMTLDLGTNVLRHPAQAPPGPAGPAEFLRVGLAGPSGRTDLAVPAAVPLARLLPMLLGAAGAEPGPDGGVRHGGWVLRRPDGTRLDAAGTLSGQGVAEGDLLFLGHGADDAAPPLYDDVVEVIGEHGVRRPWAAPATRYAAAAFAALAVLTGCAALAVAPGALPGWLAAATAAAVLAVGALMARGFGDVRAGTCAGLLAAAPAAVGAVRLLGGGGWPGAGQLMTACAAVTVVGVVGPVLIGGGNGAFTTLVVAGPQGAAAVGVCVVWRDTGAAEAASVAGPFALALTTLWPQLALRVARVPAPEVAATAEDLDRLPSRLAHARLVARIDAARGALGGMNAGSHLVAGGAALVLFAATDVWAGLLGGVLTALILLRARLFREAGHVATALATGLAAAAGAAVWTVADRAGQVSAAGTVLPAALAAALIAGAAALAAGRQRVNPRLSRALDMLETTLLVAVVPLVLAVWGVYATLLNLWV
ncbi:type VII secretion integral membrane protein EccD [Streptomyces sp. MAR4 CNX-425]|uniref:type VII secretion integral membrane protein EccD n=1 Tax=Streptomyces sp. MAR4 CNX-425 TaxID=3406343 RepID=UPI003B51132F